MKPSPLPPDAPAAGRGPDAACATEREWLSALADGQGDALQPGCEVWRRDAQARATWHAWHLIGDVMRSEELAQTPAHDAAFLSRLRDRLAAEPVPLASAPSRLEVVRRRQSWMMPAAVAAGFMAVAGALLVVQMGAGDAPSDALTLAGGTGQSAGVRLVAHPGSTAAPPVMDSQFIRDAQIDSLLEAHRGARGGAVVMSGGMKRHLDAVMPASVSLELPAPVSVR